MPLFFRSAGPTRYGVAGQFDLWLLASVVVGLPAGTFLGAGYIRRAPRQIVRTAMLTTPFTAGLLLVFGPGG